MKNGSTLILKLVLTVIALMLISLCVIILPQVIAAELKGDFDYLPILLGLYMPAIPFFLALYQAFKLLNFIDKNKTFTEAAVTTLKNMKLCGIAISALFAAMMPYVFSIAQQDDAPGLAAIGFAFIFASGVVATAAGVFQRLLQNAVDIKKENDLTV